MSALSSEQGTGSNRFVSALLDLSLPGLDSPSALECINLSTSTQKYEAKIWIGSGVVALHKGVQVRTEAASELQQHRSLFRQLVLL